MIAASAGYAWWQGPATHPRSQVLAEIGITALGAAMAVSTPLCSFPWCVYIQALWVVVLVFVNNTIGFYPLWLVMCMRNRPVHEQLTHDEYIQRGMDDTQKELDRLRHFIATSPAHVSLELLSRLDNPKPTIEFALTGNHLPPEQTDAHLPDL